MSGIPIDAPVLFPPREGYALDIYLPWVQAAQIKMLREIFPTWPSVN